MGVRQPVKHRAPIFEHGFHQGGTHWNNQSSIWQTVTELSDKRGTMFIRFSSYAGNAYVELRVTIDGVAFPINCRGKAAGIDPIWIFDFNKSVKIEDWNQTANQCKTEYGYNTWRP